MSKKRAKLFLLILFQILFISCAGEKSAEDEFSSNELHPSDGNDLEIGDKQGEDSAFLEVPEQYDSQSIEVLYILWEKRFGSRISAKPAIDGNERLYLSALGEQYYPEGPNLTSTLYSVGPDGEVEWSAKLDKMVQGYILFDQKKNIYLYGSGVFAFTCDGIKSWWIDTGKTNIESLAIGKNGDIVALGPRQVSAITNKGEILWTFDSPETLRSDGFVVDANGLILFTGYTSGNLYALEHDGQLKWIRKLIDKDENYNFKYVTTPPIATDQGELMKLFMNRIIFLDPSNGKTLKDIALKGVCGSNEALFSQTGNFILFQHSIAGSSDSIIGSIGIGNSETKLLNVANPLFWMLPISDGSIIAQEETGKIIHIKNDFESFSTLVATEMIYMEPLLSESGRLYLTAMNDGVIRAYQLSGAAPQLAGWTRKKRDNQNSSSALAGWIKGVNLGKGTPTDAAINLMNRLICVSGCGISKTGSILIDCGVEPCECPPGYNDLKNLECKFLYSMCLEEPVFKCLFGVELDGKGVPVCTFHESEPDCHSGAWKCNSANLLPITKEYEINMNCYPKSCSSKITCANGVCSCDEFLCGPKPNKCDCLVYCLDSPACRVCVDGEWACPDKFSAFPLGEKKDICGGGADCPDNSKCFIVGDGCGYCDVNPNCIGLEFHGIKIWADSPLEIPLNKKSFIEYTFLSQTVLPFCGDFQVAIENSTPLVAEATLAYYGKVIEIQPKTIGTTEIRLLDKNSGIVSNTLIVHVYPQDCGNEILDEGEKCDLNIKEGKGSCPSECIAKDQCLSAKIDGYGCQKECKFFEKAPSSEEDGCCPFGGSVAGDPDCSGLCGNGFIDGTETCEDDCPLSCEGEDKCTMQIITGDECHKRCVSIPIPPKDGDGCCGEGSHKGVDEDCPVECGNSITEEGEACDGNCEFACDDIDGCTVDIGDDDNCVCTHLPFIDDIIQFDGCCPAWSDQSDDIDCAKCSTLEECQLWKKDYSFISGRTAISKNNILYVPAYSSIDAIDASIAGGGKLLWQFSDDMLAGADIVLDNNGTLLLLRTRSGEHGYPEEVRLTAVDTDGKKVWDYNFEKKPFAFGLSVSPDNLIYVAGENLFAFTSEGDLKWQVTKADLPVKGECVSYHYFNSPISDWEGDVIASDTGNVIHKFADEGAHASHKWSLNLQNTTHGLINLVVGIKPYIYIKSLDSIYGIIDEEDNVSISWSRQADEDSSFSTPVVDEEGKIYVGRHGNKKCSTIALTKEGTILWETPVNQGVSCSPINIVIGRNDTLYISAFNSVTAMKKSGKIVWNFDDDQIKNISLMSGEGSLIIHAKTFPGVFAEEHFDGIVAIKTNSNGYEGIWPGFHGDGSNSSSPSLP